MKTEHHVSAPSQRTIHRRKLLWAGLVVGVLLALGAVAWSAVWASGPRSDAWQTDTVRRGDIEATVAAVGSLLPLDSVEVGAQVSGQIVHLPVKAGDAVQAGQVLAEIDASVIEATVEAGRAEIKALEAELADAQAQKRLAQLKWQRQKTLVGHAATTQEALEESHASHDSSQAKVQQLTAKIQQLKASLRADEARLGYTRITAPMAGTITSVDAKLGQTLNATYQTPTVLRIADLSRMQVWTQVSEADIGRIRAGQRAWFTTMGNMGQASPRQWHGVVSQVLPAPPVKAGQEESANATGAMQAVQYTVLFDVPNDDGQLMPQMTAQVVFVTESAQDVLLAPLGGLSPSAQEDGVWTARVLDAQGSIQERQVRTGKQDRLAAEVLQGLAAGEAVITGENVPPTSTRWLQW